MYVIHHTILVITISYKGQATPGLWSYCKSLVVYKWAHRSGSTHSRSCASVFVGHRPSFLLVGRGEHRPFEWGRRVCGGLSSALGVARCGRSAGCVLCVLWGMSAAVLGGGVPCGGKHIIIIIAQKQSPQLALRDTWAFTSYCLLLGVRKRINRHFILPARLHCPRCSNTIARLLSNI